MNNHTERFNQLSSEFYEIRNKLACLQAIEKADTSKLMSIEIAKQSQQLIDRLIAVTNELIELKS